MERKWTDEQLSAINTRDKTLLVSAAAGSGKTATLTERIIRSLTDVSSPMDIDSILVVTFTNAAAAELRTKVSRAIAEAVEKNPENKHLKRQLYLLPSAKIRTIDSFCNELLRANCDRVGLPPNYRIADTAECELLAISIIEGLIEAVYNGEAEHIASPTEFEELCDCLTDSKRTEELAEVFRYIHLKCDSAEEGIELLKRLVDNYKISDLPVEKNVFGAYLMDRLKEFADHYINALSRYERMFSQGSEAEMKYIGMVDSDLSLLRRIADARSYSEAREWVRAFTLVRRPTVRNGKTPRMEEYVILRDMLKEDIAGLSGYFEYTPEMWEKLFSELYRLLSSLYRFLKEFDSLFAEEKRRRGALSYADIERYTYNCLIKDGEPTDIAKNTASQFEAIYIDEYQDVNSLQNRIFEAISRPDNRFMVGDIKQSIYGFRSARPEIFANMKSAFPSLEMATGDEASIFMSRNFRCDRAVVDFVNSIFDRAFSLVGESIGYREGDRLVYSKIQEKGEPEYIRPEIYMISKPTDDADMTTQDAVASKVRELINGGTLDNGRPIRPSDIAIIMRNASGHDVKYAEALERQGIPSCISGAKDFFLCSEVLLCLCLLNSIDNPRRDIYLAGLLCSPLFDFTPDDLYRIRGCEGESLYESLVKYVETDPSFAKGRYFLDRLEYYREIAEGMSVDSLLNKLYAETGLLALASKNGGKDNLMLLYDYARSYEAGSYKGLYSFISFINKIIDKKTSFDDTRVADADDAVKIVTCHASKGLEYPVVFLVEADGRISNKDKNKRLAFSEDFGICFRLRTPSGLALVNNPVQDIINHALARKLYEEELRILYVALTRARERLFVYGGCPTVKREEYEELLCVMRENLSEYSLRSLNSYQEIILCCTGNSPEDYGTREGAATEESRELSTVSAEMVVDAPVEELSCEELCERFNFKYSSPYLTLLPEKMSVSAMSPTVLDGTDEEAVLLTEESEKKILIPSFMSGTGADESAKKGIATHLFMQFCDFSLLEKNGARSELCRLQEKGFLSKEDAERVRLREIDKFTRSRLFLKMLRADKIYRELRFNIRLPASAFTEDEEKIAAYGDREILVQGVIDCVVLEGGEVSVYDYKTDRLTLEELSDPTLAAEKLRKKHKVQLDIYALAVERIFGKRATRCAVYSLPLGDTVDM